MSVAAVVALGMGGCAAKVQDDGGGFVQPTPHGRTSRLIVPLSPRDAAVRIAGVFRDPFDFSIGDTVFRKQKPEQAVEGDYFSARTNAYTSTGEKISVVCKWIGERKTSVTITSNLPAEQHEFVMHAIRKAIDVGS